MGSGSRFKLYRSGGFNIGFGVSRMPFAVTVWLGLTFWNVSIGLGKAYDA